MRTSDKGIHLMHLFEGYRDKPYLCSASMWTIGWGHVLYQHQINLPLVRKEGYTGPLRAEYQLHPEDNRVWPKEELVEIFKNDLVSFERGVLRLAPNLNSPEHQHKFDACVAFSFNVGLGNFQRSTIRQKILREDWDGAAEAFMQWTKAGGKVLKGLVRRRQAEVDLFKTA
jgi:GH24 family phage-related lysozyme (muramidase)